MTKSSKLSPQRARERALFVYRSAVERGDFEAAAVVLKLAERDPILDRMIAEMDELDAPPAERPAQAARPPHNRPPIEQIVIVRPPSPDGQTPDSNHHKEEDEMFATMTQVHPGTPRNFGVRFLTALAAAIVVALVGAILFDMVGEPIGGLPIFGAAQTDEPTCTDSTVIDIPAEAERLGAEARQVITQQARNGAELAAMLAVCALRSGYSTDADYTLQRTLGMFGEVAQFRGHDWGYNTSVFSPDSKYLLVGSGYEATLYDIASREAIHTFTYDRTGGDRVNPVAFSPDGTMILTYHQLGSARLWDTESSEAIRDLDTLTNGGISTLTFSPDGAKVLLGLVNGQVQVWDANAGTMERAFQAGSGFTSTAMYTPDGLSILTVIQRENAARLWDADTGEEIRSFSGHSGGVNSAAFSADGRFVLTAGEEGTAILHNTETGEALYTFEGFERDVNVVAFSPDDKYALVGSADLTARLYDLETDVSVRYFAVNDNFVASAAFSPDGSTVLLGSVEGNVRLWPVDLDSTLALACQHITRDFTAEERQQYGLGEGTPCPV